MLRAVLAIAEPIPADRNRRTEDPLSAAIQTRLDRMLVDEPFAAPQPVMGPGIDLLDGGMSEDLTLPPACI